MNIDNLIKEWAKDIKRYDDMQSDTNESYDPFDDEEKEYFDFIKTHRNPKSIMAFFKDGSSKDITDKDILSFVEQNNIDFIYKKQPDIDYITIDGHKFDGRVLDNINQDIFDAEHMYDDEFDESSKENDETVITESNGYTKDVDYFEGKRNFAGDLGNHLKDIDIEDNNEKMYAISGQMIHWICKNLNEAFNIDMKPMDRAHALVNIRNIFGEDTIRKNEFWEEVPETENHTKDRKYAEGASKFYNDRRSAGINWGND